MNSELKKKMDEIEALYAKFKKIAEAESLSDGERFDANAAIGAILLKAGNIIASKPRSTI